MTAQRVTPAVVNDIEEETPSHRRRGPLTAEELERAIPALGGQSLPALGDCRVLRVICLEYFLHRRRHPRRSPFGRAAFERVDDHPLLAHDLPGDLVRGARLRIRTVVRPLRNSREHVAGDRRFVGPELDEERLFVHAVSRTPSMSLCRLAAWPLLLRHRPDDEGAAP